VCWTISNGRLNWSILANLPAYTSVLSTRSSIGVLLHPKPPSCEENQEADGCLFSGKASPLDAFRGYPQRLSCPAMPCRTTGTPEAALRCSSRTERNLPSNNHRPHQVETDLSHDGLTQLTFPFNGRAAPPLAPAAGPGWEEPTSRYQSAGTIGTLARDEPVTPGVTFLSPPAPNSEDLEDR